MKRAVIVSSADSVSELAQQILRAEGYSKVAVTSSGSQARRLLNTETSPDIVVINTPLTDEFGQELAEMTADITSAGVVMICRSEIIEDVSNKLTSSEIHLVPSPVSRQVLSDAVREADSSADSGLKKENDDILSKIEEMRLINRAKVTLMQYLKFTEPQAHRYIEKQAMNNRQTRRETALKILSDYNKK